MTGESTPTRRRVLSGLATSGLVYAGLGQAAADEHEEPFDQAFSTTAHTSGAATMAAAYPPTIDAIVSPLAMNPAIHVGNETLRIELDEDVDPDEPTVRIQPTFGSVRPTTDLAVASVEDGTSELWLDHDDRPVTVLEASLPPVADREHVDGGGPAVAPGLYDVVVEWAGGEDRQPRSLALWESYPDEPRIYVVSDAHAGDPRALGTGIEESAEEGDPEPFLFRYENVLGVGTDTERWGGFRRTVAEVNLLDPDIVLFPGDFAFGQDAPKKFYQEYADAYAMVSALDAPVYTALGNHDGYIQVTTDGKQLYHNYIGPWYYSRELWDGFRLTCLDTYDWGPTDREGVSYGVSAWGGQVRDEQFERLEARLTTWRDANPDATHVAFSHHSPSWRRDPDNELKSAGDGTPLVEQVTRGAGDFSDEGQAWAGDDPYRVRELLSKVDTVLHVAGHVHRDRLARRTADGDVVYTPNGDERLRAYDDSDADVTDAYSHAELEAELLGGDGTLYVDATTAGSETEQYWGWRFFDVDTDADSIDPSAFGYPASEAFLDDRAVDPDAWPVEHAVYGRYSHPSFLLDAEAIETEDAVTIEVYNETATRLSGTLLLAAPACNGLGVDGGELLWRRTSDEGQDVAVAYTVDAASSHAVTLSCQGRS